MSKPESSINSDIESGLPDTIGLDKIPDAVLIADAETRRIVYTNAAATELFRCQPGDLVGRPQTDLHPAGEADAYAEAFERGLRDQRVNRLQSGDPLFIKTVGGDSVPVEITVQTITVEGNGYLMGIFREASDQLARERALKKTTGRLEALLEALPVPVCVLDTDGTVKRWNQAAEETLGYTADQLIGQQYSLLIDTEEFASLLERVGTGETIEDYRTDIRARDGSRIPVEVDVRPIYDDGSVSGIVGIATDLSDRDQRKQQLDILHRVARHNLRNELTVIRGWGEAVEDTGFETGKAIAEIMNASDRLLELSDEIGNIQRPVSEERHGTTSRDISSLLTTLSEQLLTNESVVDTELAAKSTAGQVRAKAVEATSELFDTMFQCNGSAAVRLEVDAADNHITLFVTSDTPMFCSGDRVLIQEGTETALDHASGLKTARSYLAIQSVGGAVSLESGPTDAPATSLRIEFPRVDM